MAGGTAPAGGRWARLGARLGLVPVKGRGPRGRGVRCLVGERGGRLVALWGSHSIDASSVDVMVRYPQRTTVRGMRESLLNDPELAAAFGRKLAVPRSRRKDLIVGDGTVVMRLKYTLVPPSPKRVERVVDALLAAVGREARGLDRVCEVCLQAKDPSVYFVDGFPGYYCETCVETQLAGETERAAWLRSVAPDYGRGAVLGSSAAVAIGLLGGSLAAVAMVRVGTPVLVNPSAVLILLLAAAAGFGIATASYRGFQDFKFASGLLPLPAAWLGAVVFSGAMRLVARQTLAPGPYTLRLAVTAFASDLVGNRAVSLAITGAFTGGSLAAAAWRLRRVRAARRVTRVEHIEGL